LRRNLLAGLRRCFWRGETMMKSFLTVLTMLFLGAALAAQEEPAKSTKPDKEVADKLAELKKIVSDKKFEHDGDAPPIITTLMKKREAGMFEKDVEDVVKGLKGAMMDGKLREPSNLGLYKAAGYALGDFGAAGAKALKELYENARFPKKKEWVPLREVFLKAMGRTKDEGSVKFLIDEARTAVEAAQMAAAGEALGNFEGSNQKIRDEVVKGLLTRYGDLDSRSRQLDPADVEAQKAREYLAVISDKWNTTLSRLTRQNFRTHPEWQQWYNKNKDTEWK
jgi:hypothetical protein